MKILKIVVDKLPRTCAECNYLYFDGKFMYYVGCIIVRFALWLENVTYDLMCLGTRIIEKW